jgi:hypothetical protein
MEELDGKIAAILMRFGLTADEWSVERVREDVAIAQEAARDTAALKLPKAKAIEFVNAAKLLLRIAREYGLADEQDLRVINRLGKEAKVRLALTERPLQRAWLGPCAANFRGAWEALTANPSGLHYGDEPSPALQFVTACCRIIDESINESAVLRAYRLHAETKEMTPEEYEEFCQSDLWRELSRSDL